MPNLDIIIVNWNSGFFISDCIESIMNSNHEDVKNIIIIDNDSIDNSLENLKSFNKVKI